MSENKYPNKKTKRDENQYGKESLRNIEQKMKDCIKQDAFLDVYFKDGSCESLVGGAVQVLFSCSVLFGTAVHIVADISGIQVCKPELFFGVHIRIALLFAELRYQERIAFRLVNAASAQITVPTLGMIVPKQVNDIQLLRSLIHHIEHQR